MIPKVPVQVNSGRRAAGNRHPAYRKLVFAISVSLSILLVSTAATAQEQGRQTLEIGAIGQTNSNLYTAPYIEVPILFGTTYDGTPNRRYYGGAQLGYRYALNRNLELETRIGYLFGHQPVVTQSGGQELQLHTGLRISRPLGRFTIFGRVAPGFSHFSDAARYGGPLGGEPTYTGSITHFSVE